MAESAAAEETRVAEAVARLLARQASLLARAADDEAAASAARLGLSWLVDLMRSFDLHGAADWFQALRTRDEAPRAGEGPTAAWARLAAPLCDVLAGEVSRATSLEPLGADAVDWAARVAEIGAFEEPPPAPAEARDPGVPDTPEVPPVEPAPEPNPRIDPGVPPPPREEPPLPRTPEIEPPQDAEVGPQHALFEAIAEFAGDQVPDVEAQADRIRIRGQRPLAHHKEALEALDRAVRVAGAVLELTTQGDTLAWTVRLARPGTVPAPVQPEAPHEEAVQPGPVPADNQPEDRAPGRPRALVADDSMMARVFLGRLLAQRGIVVEEAEDGAAARAKLASAPYELVFLDAEMPGAGALEILGNADEATRSRACVLVKDDEERRRAEAFGGLPILYKPFAEDEVRGAVDRLLAHRH